MPRCLLRILTLLGLRCATVEAAEAWLRLFLESRGSPSVDCDTSLTGTRAWSVGIRVVTILEMPSALLGAIEVDGEEASGFGEDSNGDRVGR